MQPNIKNMKASEVQVSRFMITLLRAWITELVPTL